MNEPSPRPRVVALVPMRHDSKRVPGKNWRRLAGRPLFCHVVDALHDSGVIDEIVIDTDSDVVRQIAARQCPQVTLIERPAHLRDDKLPMNDVLLHTTGVVAADVYLQTHSTNPLLRPTTIAAAVRRFLRAEDRCDSLFGVTRLQQRLWDADVRPINHDPAMLLRTQDLPPVYAENSCLYVFTRETLVRDRNRIGRRPIVHEIERDEAWDIDEETDFTIAELLHAARDDRTRSAA
jgi:CMP-N-acetylneuraminic acid synthetase